MHLQDSNQRFLQAMDGKHLQHVLKQGKYWWRERLKHHFGYDVWKLPVCNNCEGYALWHKDEKGNAVGTCTGCGHITKNPITVEQYYEQGHHIDRTGYGRGEPVVLERQKVKKGGDTPLPVTFAEQKNMK